MKAAKSEGERERERRAWERKANAGRTTRHRGISKDRRIPIRAGSKELSNRELIVTVRNVYADERSPRERTREREKYGRRERRMRMEERKPARKLEDETPTRMASKYGSRKIPL